MMKTWRFRNLVLALVLAAMLPGGGAAAAVVSQGQASILWDSIYFSSAVHWSDDSRTDTRGTLSGASLGLNGQADSAADMIGAAGWGMTNLQNQLTDGSGAVSASAYTNFTGGALLASPEYFGPSQSSMQYASSDIQLNGSGQGNVDLSQAVISGQFTVDQWISLSISAKYHFDQYLDTAGAPGAASAYNAVWARLVFENMDEGESAFDEMRFARFFHFDSPGAFALPTKDQDGVLTISMDLMPGYTYNFLAQAGTTAYVVSAAVPEPISLALLGSGMIGVAIFRRKLK